MSEKLDGRSWQFNGQPKPFRSMAIVTCPLLISCPRLFGFSWTWVLGLRFSNDQCFIIGMELCYLTRWCPAHWWWSSGTEFGDSYRGHPFMIVDFQDAFHDGWPFKYTTRLPLFILSAGNEPFDSGDWDGQILSEKVHGMCVAFSNHFIMKVTPPLHMSLAKLKVANILCTHTLRANILHMRIYSIYAYSSAFACQAEPEPSLGSMDTIPAKISETRSYGGMM